MVWVPCMCCVKRVLLSVMACAKNTEPNLSCFQLINRTLLHWIKLWDVVVFGKEPPAKKEKKKNKENIKKKKFQMEVSDELDKFNRPEQKV